MTDNESLESQVKRLAEFITDWITGEPSQSQGAIDTAMRLLAEYSQALAFYAEPTSYIGIGLWGDKPCGEFIEDFSYDNQLDRDVPGKLARQTLGWETDEPA